MEIREGDRSRNNKLIFLTAGVVLMLIILSMQTHNDDDLVKINVGDSSFQLANRLSEKGVYFESLTHADGIKVRYTPVTPFDRLNNKHQGSRYEIYFEGGKVAKIIWLSESDRKLGELLYVKVGAVS